MNEKLCNLAVSQVPDDWDSTWSDLVWELEQKEKIYPYEIFELTKSLLQLTNDDFRQLLYSYCVYKKINCSDDIEVLVLNEFHELRNQLLDRISNLPISYISSFHKFVFLKLVGKSVYLLNITFKKLFNDPKLFTTWDHSPLNYFYIAINEDGLDINIEVYQNGKFNIKCNYSGTSCFMEDTGHHKNLYQYLALFAWE